MKARSFAQAQLDSHKQQTSDTNCNNVVKTGMEAEYSFLSSDETKSSGLRALFEQECMATVNLMTQHLSTAMPRGTSDGMLGPTAGEAATNQCKVISAARSLCANVTTGQVQRFSATKESVHIVTAPPIKLYYRELPRNPLECSYSYLVFVDLA